MRRALLLAGLALVLVSGGILAFTSPPRLLSVFDRVAGGGAGARQVAEGVAFGTHGQTLDIWAPADPPAGKLPVVIFWYGGGWAKGDRAAYAFAGRALAKDGFLVVIPDYRKVPDVLFPAFLDDGAEAVAWVQANVAEHGGDPGRVAFMGHSAGAYQAVMLALDSKRLAAAGADPGIVKAAVGLSGPYDFYPFDKPRSIAATSCARSDSRTKHCLSASSSCTNFATRRRPSTTMRPDTTATTTEFSIVWPARRSSRTRLTPPRQADLRAALSNSSTSSPPCATRSCTQVAKQRGNRSPTNS
jgi:acetyl esterase/lipase